jgi:hypothetical protein
MRHDRRESGGSGNYITINVGDSNVNIEGCQRGGRHGYDTGGRTGQEEMVISTAYVWTRMGTQQYKKRETIKP